MSKKKRLFDLTGIGLAAVFILASCSLRTTTAALATQTASPQPAMPVATGTASPQPAAPTATGMASLTATVPALPTATATEPPTITPTLVTVAQVSPGWNAYCRKGPGADYYAVTFLKAESSYPVIGRDGRDVWWQVQATPKIQCWEGDPTSVTQGPVEAVPIVLAPPLPLSPSTFDSTYHCDSSLNTMTVWLTWTTAEGATGYNIYRNGSLIVQLGPTATSYTDNAPRGVDLNYQIEAFNDYGVAPRLTTKISVCE